MRQKKKKKSTRKKSLSPAFITEYTKKHIPAKIPALEAFSCYLTRDGLPPWQVDQADKPNTWTNGSSRTELVYCHGVPVHIYNNIYLTTIYIYIYIVVKYMLLYMCTGTP